MDQQLFAALAGTGDAEPPVVEWEGLTYRFDRRTAQFERFIQTRNRLGGNRLDAVLALSEAVRALASGAVADPATLVEQLRVVCGRGRNPTLRVFTLSRCGLARPASGILRSG